MANWSVLDKHRLLVALRQHGTDDIEQITKCLPSKSITDVSAIISKYRKIAESKWTQEDAGVDSPMRSWIDISKKLNLQHKYSAQNIVSRVLKYIYLYEKQSDIGNPNLSECYKVLSDITNGNPSKDLDSDTAFFLRECLKMLAESLQHQDLAPTKNFFKSLDTFAVTEKNVNCLNPFNVPEQLLKMKKSDTESDVFTGF